MFLPDTDPPPSADEPTGIASRAAKSGGAMFIAKSVRFVFLFFVNFILINLLVPADFGMMRYVMLIVGIAGLLNEMGLTTAIVQKERLDRESLWPLFCISSLWGAMLYGAIFFLATPLSRFFAVPELVCLLRIGALMIPAAGISAVQRAWLRRRMEYGKLALIEMAAAGFSAMVSIALAFAGFGVWALVAGNLLFEAGISAVVMVVCRITVTPFQPFGALRSLIFFGVAIVISRLVDYVLCNAPFFFIGKWIGKEGLGLFSVARDLAVFPQTAINAALGHVLVSTFSRIQTDDEKTAAGFGRLLLFGSIFTLPISLVMAVAPYELVKVVCIVKKESAWLEAAPLLRWLALMGIPYVFTTFSSSIWISRGKVVESIYVSSVIGGTVVAAILIGEQWGLTGICRALFLQALMVFPPYVYIQYRLTRIPVTVFFFSLVPSLVAGGFMTAVLIAVQCLIPEYAGGRHFMVLFGGGILGVAVYGVTLMFFFRSSMRHLRALMRMLLPNWFRAVKKKEDQPVA
ncbi:MAG: lipopolysaccharide biosynthesis protein [Chitinispirillaceae bacterium]|nr:lipopolysaccharide biosynthesis protein [Chitinispirillaceae bacterium]